MRNDEAIALNRFGLGATPGSALGANPHKALLNQFDSFDPRPPLIAAQPARAELVSALSEVREEKQQRKAAAQTDMAADAEKTPLPARRAVRKDYVSAVHARLQTALSSPTSFAERLVHFWANHFAVSIEKIAIFGLAGNFEFEAIRPHIFGRFANLLHASTYHPAMLLYLDQAQSVGPNSKIAQRVGARGKRDIGLNENLAREILELHTLSDRSAYSQTDVTEFARAMTGLTVGGLGRARFQRLTGNSKPGEAVFVEAMHEPGKRTIVGQTYAQGGEKALGAILSDLSTNRATARHIATKLARHFVADLPPATLVAKLEASFLKTGGDLPSLYRTLIEAPESWAPQQAKFKNPWEWTVSALRALGVTEMPGREQAAVALFNQMGQPVWKPGSPKGYGDVAADWAGPAGLLRRVETAGRFARLAANRVDARNLAPDILGDALTKTTAEHIARAESPEQGLALMLVAPEFLRR
ncbi:DUF1800 domain-containing protein [Sphingorhabdus sp.]|uniref:DUF1800 domain-containing protein n=1 Tax=Sphingorhabdus sp. TaxID=1902408 RepID=UPI003BAFB466|nr:DUF1800 domain-containing protein [Sphingomonadales bacterium]MBK9432687.1 DUF1800 domain-containing protein [Sphingomonadales bacterium]MBL0022524.1 DUF1800 domain-containing protein [Sphingomonadales bacterium]